MKNHNFTRFRPHVETYHEYGLSIFVKKRNIF